MKRESLFSFFKKLANEKLAKGEPFLTKKDVLDKYYREFPDGPYFVSHSKQFNSLKTQLVKCGFVKLVSPGFFKVVKVIPFTLTSHSLREMYNHQVKVKNGIIKNYEKD